MLDDNYQISATTDGKLVVVHATILVPASFTTEHDLKEFYFRTKALIIPAVRLKITGRRGISKILEYNSPMHPKAVMIVECDDAEAAGEIAKVLNEQPE